MKKSATTATAFAAGLLLLEGTAPASATGLATCDSGARSGWQSQDVLKQRLVKQGWQVRNIKIDGGCYEVYALTDKGERVEAYYHPVTLKHVLTSRH
jgi:hypothetical protein